MNPRPFWRKDRPARQPPPADKAMPTPAPQQAPQPDDLLFAETVARHFDQSRLDGSTVLLGFDDARLQCTVDHVRETGNYVTAALFLYLTSGQLGPSTVFLSISGYGASSDEAIVGGACLWCCELAPVLRAALAGTAEETVDTLAVSIDGRDFRMSVGGLDRGMETVAGAPVGDRTQPARTRLGGTPWLAPAVVAADVLPILPDTPTVLSIFVAESETQRTVEVKVNGADWAPAALAFPQPLEEPPHGMALLRELAVLLPQPGLTVPPRTALDRTLAGLAARDMPWNAAGWPGWKEHRGLLGPVLSSAELDRLERDTGPLAAEHRDFLLHVSASGAGPGYGLLPPVHAGDVLPLADAGCGVTWGLRLDEPHRGEVWIDATAADGTVAPVASSFLGWYLAWIDAAVRDAGPWTPWETMQCATASVVSQLLHDINEPPPIDLSSRLEPGSIALSNSDGEPLLPCHGCTTLVSRFGLDDRVFARR